MGLLCFSAAVLASVSVTVDVNRVVAEVSPWLYGTGIEDVNHEVYGGLDAQRLFGESFEESLPTGRDAYQRHGVSGAWEKAESRDGGDFIWVTNDVHQGRAAQRLEPQGGVAAIANRGLRGWGIPCRTERPMRGYVWAKGVVDRLEVSLESAWGERTLATVRIDAPVDDAWRKLVFELRPSENDDHGRFVIRASGKGGVCIDDAFLADAPTGRVGELGCREDIVAALKEEGVTFLRWGGSMINAKAYRLAVMRGKGERRPYEGHWYRQSSGGFGPYEFVRLAAELKLPCAVALNVGESVDDAVAFARFAKTFDIPIFVQIGNEELTGYADPDDKPDLTTCRRYCQCARRLAEAMRAENAKLRFVCGVMWGNSKLHLDLREAAFRELDGVMDYWDIHPYFTTPQEALKARGLIQEAQNQLLAWNPRTKMKIAVFEENGNNHGMDRALAHAVFLGAARTAGANLLTSCPANALQPYLHNDNWWDQGSVFFTPTRVWLQPCGWAQRMASENHRELAVACSADDADVSTSATRNRDGTSVVLHVVNMSAAPKKLVLAVVGANLHVVKATSLFGNPCRADNPPDDPLRVSPQNVLSEFAADGTVRPYSYTVLELK